MGLQRTITAVILTKNRPGICLQTIAHTAQALQGLNSSIVIINNGGTPFPLPEQSDGIPIIEKSIPHNMGASARNLALHEAQYLLMLDDDARISPSCVQSAIKAMNADPSLGAVAFRIQSPQGSEEACLLPTVFHGCACCFRASALQQAGGYPAWCRYYGEEYSVAFHLYMAGFRIGLISSETAVLHLRDPAGRNISRILALNIINNLTLWASVFPLPHLVTTAYDTLKRYALVAGKEQAIPGFLLSLPSLPRAVFRGLLHRNPMDAALFRQVTMIEHVRTLCLQARQNHHKQVTLCGTGKFPTLLLNEIQSHGLTVSRFLDTNPCWKTRAIRTIPVLVPDPDDPYATRLLHSLPDNTCFFTGCSSIPESLFWQTALTRAGRTPVWQDGWAENSATGIIDLLHTHPISVFTHNNKSCKAL